VPIQKQLDVLEVGKIGSIQERYYAITIQRKIKHPVVSSIYETARRDVFHAVHQVESCSEA
jgi:LysR family transcriptional activator of nhaA